MSEYGEKVMLTALLNIAKEIGTTRKCVMLSRALALSLGGLASGIALESGTNWHFWLAFGLWTACFISELRCSYRLSIREMAYKDIEDDLKKLQNARK